MPEPQHIGTSLEAALASLVEQAVERALARLEPVLNAQNRQPAGSHDDASYIEPGPHSVRQFFTAQELAQRWGWGKTKVYELTDAELPAWRHGQQVRYFWAFVWAFEGRLSREQAASIWHAFQATEQQLLAHPSRLARVR